MVVVVVMGGFFGGGGGGGWGGLHFVGFYLFVPCLGRFFRFLLRYSGLRKMMCEIVICRGGGCHASVVIVSFLSENGRILYTMQVTVHTNWYARAIEA